MTNSTKASSVPYEADKLLMCNHTAAQIAR